MLDFNTKLACDGQTDRQMQGHRASIAASRAGKN